MKEQNNQYVEMGKGIKEGMKGLNTVASPKKKRTCVILCLIPLGGLVIMFIFGFIGGLLGNQNIMLIGYPFVLTSGFCSFYAGKVKKGLIYTFTLGILFIGILIDLFKLVVTGTYKDANGFPVIY